MITISRKEWTTRRIVLLGLFIAVNMAATYIHIPIGPSMMHLGTATLFITALILNPMDSAIASGGGMFLFDIFGGFFSYAPFTLIIKGAMAYIVANISQSRKFNGENIYMNAFAYFVGGIISLVGYYFTNVYFSGNFVAPLSKIPGSILTTSVGIIIALPIGIQVKKGFKKLEVQNA
ncbi:ECF transporter S component [Clostridiisalibacter paucivorans]|uniref:ECF transporter S component n=1 Tax=Clostridiisalibacter paucivorans TaxID=408753 RepID=UPI00047D1DEC|nr:ECF transporter S component [Clostridiisalibacter paucivorans]